jgi:hypothetical protein
MMFLDPRKPFNIKYILTNEGFLSLLVEDMYYPTIDKGESCGHHHQEEKEEPVVLLPGGIRPR